MKMYYQGISTFSGKHWTCLLQTISFAENNYKI